MWTRRFGWREWVQMALTAAALFFFIQMFVLQGFRVYGCCMEPNLRSGERLLSNRFIYRVLPPRRGDIIVFRYPNNRRKFYVKRIIGMPGETVTIRDGTVSVNGRELWERYVTNVPHGDYAPTVVPENHFFVLGDNRDHSSDSRTWGTVPYSDVEGKVWLRYWPLLRLEIFG